MKKYKVILLVDMDSFYASCHITLDKTLENVPFIVSTKSDRSVVASSNYKARDLGITAGMPNFKAKAILPNIRIVESDFALYSRISREVFELISSKYTHKIEVASIDECFIDASNIWQKYGSVKNLCDNIRNSIYYKFNITCSVGASYNKDIAKIAVELNKPNGSTVVKKADFESVIWPLPVNKLYGVGKVTKAKLIEDGILTISDLAHKELEFMTEHYGRVGYNLWISANGLGTDVVKYETSEPKSISNEITLENDIDDYDSLEDAFANITKYTWSRLVHRKMSCKVINIRIANRVKRKGEFVKKLNIKQNSHQVKLREYTNSYETIISNVKSILENLFETDVSVSKIGIGLSELILDKDIKIQRTIFDNDKIDVNKNEINSIIEDINLIFDNDTLLRAKDLRSFKKGTSKVNMDENRHISLEKVINKK